MNLQLLSELVIQVVQDRLRDAHRGVVDHISAVVPRSLVLPDLFVVPVLDHDLPKGKYSRREPVGELDVEEIDVEFSDASGIPFLRLDDEVVIRSTGWPEPGFFGEFAFVVDKPEVWG